jgi:DNA-binding transcriptional LysR family regulator
VRQLNLRQVEAFKAVIEYGTVSRAAEMMNVSQPAMSKLIAHLEEDTGLRLFDRVKGRLVPTRRGMRLYEESTGFSLACARSRMRWSPSGATSRAGF